VLGFDGIRVHVGGLEAIDGTPIVDVKPVLGSIEER
jgi:tRNA (Thr-GGU) A37 N-methylase